MTQYTQLFASRKDQGARTPSYLIQLAKDTFLPKTESQVVPLVITGRVRVRSLHENRVRSLYSRRVRPLA